MARLLISAGLALVALGLLVLVFNRFHVPLGKLPGDLVWRGKNTTVYFPIVTCLIVSAILSLLLWLVNRRP